MSTGTDTKANTWGGGALKVGNLRLLEDGSERGGTLVSDLVASETASAGWGGGGERVGVSTALTPKVSMHEGAAHSSEVTALPLSPSHNLVMPSTV